MLCAQNVWKCPRRFEASYSLFLSVILKVDIVSKRLGHFPTFWGHTGYIMIAYVCQKSKKSLDSPWKSSRTFGKSVNTFVRMVKRPFELQLKATQIVWRHNHFIGPSSTWDDRTRTIFHFICSDTVFFF